MPLSLLAAAAPSLIQAGAGLFQGIFGASKANKAQQELENLQTPTYGGSKSIMDYYNTALQRYNINPYQSQQYQYATNAANRNLAAGIGSLQDRRSAVGGVARLNALSNDAALKAGISAENTQNQRFGQLGSATGMKAGDEMKQFQFNQLAPFEKKYNLLAMKAGAANKMANAGFSNIFGALSSGSKLLSDDYLYGKYPNYKGKEKNDNSKGYSYNNQYIGE